MQRQFRHDGNTLRASRRYISFTIRSQSCRSIGFWFEHVQTKLSYRDTSYNHRNATRTINLPQQRERHADFPPSSFTQPFRILSRAKRSCDHSTGEYSFVDTRWGIVAQWEIPLFTFRQPSTARQHTGN